MISVSAASVVVTLSCTVLILCSTLSLSLSRDLEASHRWLTLPTTAVVVDTNTHYTVCYTVYASNIDNSLLISTECLKLDCI